MSLKNMADKGYRNKFTDKRYLLSLQDIELQKEIHKRKLDQFFNSSIAENRDKIIDFLWKDNLVDLLEGSRILNNEGEALVKEGAPLEEYDYRHEENRKYYTSYNSDQLEKLSLNELEDLLDRKKQQLHNIVAPIFAEFVPLENTSPEAYNDTKLTKYRPNSSETSDFIENYYLNDGKEVPEHERAQKISDIPVLQNQRINFKTQFINTLDVVAMPTASKKFSDYGMRVKALYAEKKFLQERYSAEAGVQMIAEHNAEHGTNFQPDPNIDFDETLLYPDELKEPVALRSTVEAFARVNAKLKKQHPNAEIVVVDGYRPPEFSDFLYEWGKKYFLPMLEDQLKHDGKHPHPEKPMTAEQLDLELQQNIAKGGNSAHNFGGAADMLIYNDGEEVKIPIEFDQFGKPVDIPDDFFERKPQGWDTEAYQIYHTALSAFAEEYSLALHPGEIWHMWNTRQYLVNSTGKNSRAQSMQYHDASHKEKYTLQRSE